MKMKLENTKMNKLYIGYLYRGLYTLLGEK